MASHRILDHIVKLTFYPDAVFKTQNINWLNCMPHRKNATGIEADKLLILYGKKGWGIYFNIKQKLVSINDYRFMKYIDFR